MSLKYEENSIIFPFIFYLLHVKMFWGDKMKKILLFLLLACLLLTGCDSNSNNSEINLNGDNSDIVAQNDVSSNESQETIKLKDPILEWCQLYNPNGFDTVTGIVSNPNDVDIDITYDLVYYKDGIEVARSESFSNFNISPKHSDVIWANYDIPKKEDVDEIKMENIFVTKSYKKSIDAEYSYEETIEHDAIYNFKFKEEPEVAYVWFLLYNDNNKNKKCDEGELVITSTDTTFEKEAKLSYEVDGIEYEKVEIYYNAY